MENAKMNIAAVTDDGLTISQHFGRAKYYEVIMTENGKIVKRERREKPGHHNFAHEEHHHHGEHHGTDGHSHQKHLSMAEVISDCSILLSRGMGTGAYQSLQNLNIKPILTNLKNIDEAVEAVLNNTIVSHTERLH